MKDPEKNLRPENQTSKLLLWINYAFIIVGIIIFAAMVKLVVVSPVDKKYYKFFSASRKVEKLVPQRGNILACDGRLLATTIPEYEIRMDCKILKKEYLSPEFDARSFKKKGWPVNESEWRAEAGLLAQGLSSTLGGGSADDYYNMIIKWRESPRGGRNVTIAKKVDHETYLALKKLPLWRKGQNIGGLMVDMTYSRRYPYGTLGRRVIGYCKLSDTTERKIGLEGSYDKELHGRDGWKVMKRMDEKGIVIQDFRHRGRKAKDGYDIRTTLDVDIQDVCDDALREFFAQFSSVQEGCVIVMETATGAIRAMVNLKRDGLDISESYNYALLNAHEPGSVFKLVTTMAALNDGYIKTLSDTIPCFDGYWTYKGAKFKQQDKHTSIKNCPEQKITIRRGIQESSNHVFHYIAGTYYGENREKFIKRLEDFHILDNFEDFDIQGVASPWVTSLESMGKKGNELSFPHLGMGYGTYITTLHIISFYNAIANNGRMMMPYLVQSIEKDGKVIERKDPKVLDVICSKAVADTLTNGLKEVTSPKRCATGGFDGTAYWAFYKAPYKMAGKTGTCFVSQGKYGYEIGGATENNSVFVGFFPADKPQYTILAGVHTSLARGNVEGSSCARVVRKVADWLWYSGVEYTKGGKTEIIMRQ